MKIRDNKIAICFPVKCVPIIWLIIKTGVYLNTQSDQVNCQAPNLFYIFIHVTTFMYVNTWCEDFIVEMRRESEWVNHPQVCIYWFTKQTRSQSGRNLDYAYTYGIVSSVRWVFLGTNLSDWGRAFRRGLDSEIEVSTVIDLALASDWSLKVQRYLY